MEQLALLEHQALLVPQETLVQLDQPDHLDSQVPMA